MIGKFKDETNGTPLREFVGLRSKMYSFKLFDEKKNKVVESKKLKGVKKNVVKRDVSFSDYYRSLMGEEKTDIQQHSSFNCIRSTTHQVHSLKVNKRGLNAWTIKDSLLTI